MNKSFYLRIERLVRKGPELSLIVQKLPWINYINVHPTAMKNISSSNRMMKRGSCPFEVIHYLSFWSWPLLGKPFPSRCLSGGHQSPSERVTRKRVIRLQKVREGRKNKKKYDICKNSMEHVQVILILTKFGILISTWFQIVPFGLWFSK